MRTLHRLAPLLVLCLVASVHVATAAPRGEGSGMALVAESGYPDGMHLAVTTIDGRDYAFASSSHLDSENRGIRVFDVTNPAKPKMVASLPCTGGQGFLTISHDKKTLVVGEGARHKGSPCMPGGEMGIYTIDITDPRKPRPLGYGSVARSGHHVTAHPTKPFVYVSYGDVPATPNEKPEFEVWSIKNPAKPKYISSGLVSGYHGPHDIAFNARGTRAVASSMTAIQVLDTSDPTKPKEVQILQCPGCTHNHEAHFTPDQKHVVVSDETTGGFASPCPLGALYFYKWNDDGPTYMDFVGQWQPDDAVVPDGAPTNVPLCTSHVFDISADGTKIVAAWHTGGVKVVDIRDMSGVGIGTQGDGAKEIAWYNASGADSWSAKFHPSGKYVFVNDRVSGFEVYRLEPSGN